MDQDFSGSWSVTSRNPLLHSGVPNATRSSRFDAEGVALCRSGALAAKIGGALATANFYEKALFVKGDVATALGPTRRPLLPFALCFYPHSDGAHTLVARCIMGSVFSGY
jgi:hypothetical protein